MNENVMNDQYGMEDLLEQEKYLIHNYGTFIPEASEMPLRTVLTDNLNGCVKDIRCSRRWSRWAGSRVRKPT